MTEELIPIGSAARRLGVSPEYLRRLSDTGRVSCVRTPLGRLFATDALDAFQVVRLAKQSHQRSATTF